MNLDNLPILIEAVLFGGGALAFGWWQMRSLRRDRARTQAQREAEARGGAGPGDPA